MIEIDGFFWFVAALIICGTHALYLRSWQCERRQHQAWWQTYDVKAQRRHEEFMHAIGRDDNNKLEWNLDSHRERGQA